MADWITICYNFINGLEFWQVCCLSWFVASSGIMLIVCGGGAIRKQADAEIQRMLDERKGEE